MDKTVRLTARTMLGLLVAALALAGVDASAQSTVYRCSTNEGRPYISDRPCEGRPTTIIGAAGPVVPRPTAPVYYPPPRKASDLLQFMSPQCAELSEGIRNGPSRGLGPAAQNELRTNYQAKCGEDERRALYRLREEQRRAYETRLADEQGARAERDRDALSREQCDEMYRIVHQRREKVSTMTSGERADFYRFEANWKARCHAP